MDLVWPATQYLPGYVEALKRGWSPDNRRAEAAVEELARIDADPVLFISQQVDREAKGPAITLPDGRSAPRLPGYIKWIWDGEFCGLIGLRWQPGTTELPPYCLGHIGYSVVPWKRRRGYATLALKLMLAQARAERLALVYLTTDADNFASQRVIEVNGGELIERPVQSSESDGHQRLNYRILLDKSSDEFS